MKKVKNLTENKVLINTFKKSKLKGYLNKSFLRKKDFYFLKYRQPKFKFLFKSFSKFIFYKNVFVCFYKFEKKLPLKIFFKKNFNFFKLLLIFNIYIFIKICKPVTATQRFKKTTFLLKFKKFVKFFKIFYKNNAGRNNIGNITIFSKGLKKKNSTVLVNKISTWDKHTSVVISIFRNQKKLYNLNKHLSGSISIHPYIDGVVVGQKIFSSNLPKNFWTTNLPGNVVFLKFLTKFSIFSNVCINGFKKLALSNGTFCQVLDHFYDFNLLKITLPSKNVKMLSGWNYVTLGRNSQIDFCYNRLGKAGINYMLGKKPKVRGVARNPVDHPHGGRTKTNQPEVSIWGWIAKRNK